MSYSEYSTCSTIVQMQAWRRLRHWLEEASTHKSAMTHDGNILCLVTLTFDLLTLKWTDFQDALWTISV